MHPIPSKLQLLVKQFTDQLFRTTSLKFSPTSPREPTPPRDEPKGKGIATEEPLKDIMPFIEEGGPVPKVPNLKSFILPEGTLSQEKFMAQLKELKRLSDMKEQEKKSEEELKKILNPATIKAQALKSNSLPITKISYIVNSSNFETMRITRDNDPFNFTVYSDFRLRMLGFSEWLEAKKLGLPPPPALATFGMTAEERKRKRTEFIKEVFMIEDVRVDGMERNLIPPPGLCQSRALP
ncbi:hypothetical protein Tco_1143035 [Tanacetum coccineum]